MRRFTVALLLSWFLLILEGLAQSGAIIPQSGAGHTVQATCVILKRMGPADQVTSRMYSFGIRGKQFQYVEGKLPEGFPFHGRLTDHDVRNLQARGAEVLVLESHYTTEDLRQARGDCRGETGQTPNKAEAKGAPSAAVPSGSTPSAPPDSASAPVSSPVPAASITLAGGKLSVGSVPDGADIEVDGSFVGNTPSDVQVADGDHTITVKKTGFKDWERKMKVSAGSSVHLNAELEKAQAQ
jgi:hypothetical protein